MVAAHLETAYRVCLIDVTTDEENSWTANYPVYNWQWKFGQGIGGSTLVNIGVYTRGNLEDYEDWGGDEFWGKNRTFCFGFGFVWGLCCVVEFLCGFDL